MRRFSWHWLLSLSLALMLVIVPPVVAGGHHGDASCLDSLVAQEQPLAWEMTDPDEPHSSAASPCCLPCLQCGTVVMSSDGRALASSLISFDAVPDGPFGPPDPIERPPRV
ncbi:hypothetical protein HOP54_08510 [Halomonas daqingensis]|uniref:DUF2946 domain-containing protein n=1 Tax=Billgrantia desiderata TaxID=52021 RepID=A0AAW4YPT1_9GAMM|nr:MULTISPECIES: hypothetical protein [Halomonas]MCE8028728.1 hypothetical protein [Halomonas desiderata]MCE8039989.1 hypothetical protein [Halomonas sp. MCCC 1A11062]MCE8049878.1 hypothetical protein [Halomonas desiderata]